MNQRMEAVEKWAFFVKNNPKKWKKIHTEFINSQFKKSDDFIKRLLNQKDGIKKILELYNIENIRGYPGLFKK